MIEATRSVCRFLLTNRQPPVLAPATGNMTRSDCVIYDRPRSKPCTNMQEGINSDPPSSLDLFSVSSKNMSTLETLLILLLGASIGVVLRCAFALVFGLTIHRRQPRFYVRETDREPYINERIRYGTAAPPHLQNDPFAATLPHHRDEPGDGPNAKAARRTLHQLFQEKYPQSTIGRLDLGGRPLSKAEREVKDERLRQYHARLAASEPAAPPLTPEEHQVYLQHNHPRSTKTTRLDDFWRDAGRRPVFREPNPNDPRTDFESEQNPNVDCDVSVGTNSEYSEHGSRHRRRSGDDADDERDSGERTRGRSPMRFMVDIAERRRGKRSRRRR